MYTPSPFSIEDLDLIEDFVRKNSFATIISSTDSFPLASHTPLLISKKGGEYFLHGHLARANKHTKQFNDLSKVLVIFQGVHGYISSYAKDPEGMSILPTWNYQLVHARGELRVFSEDELRAFMLNLTNTMEAGEPKSMNLSSYPEKEFNQKLKQIIGFEIRVTEWFACFRMNQNRTPEIRKNIKQHNSNNPDLVKAIDEANS